ncbi:hypothetical protein MTO96_002642 [Rhipicephalus appendiculatus]
MQDEKAWKTAFTLPCWSPLAVISRDFSATPSGEQSRRAFSGVHVTEGSVTYDSTIRNAQNDCGTSWNCYARNGRGWSSQDRRGNQPAPDGRWHSATSTVTIVRRVAGSGRQSMRPFARYLDAGVVGTLWMLPGPSWGSSTVMPRRPGGTILSVHPGRRVLGH